MSKLKQLTDDPIEQQILEADAKRIIEAGEQALAEADKARIQRAKREVELNRIAGDLPDDTDALWMFAEHSLAQSAVSMIDAGRAFIKLKERLPHGEFHAGLKERGISPRSARQFMATARRFADRSEKFLKLGRTKLYACIELTDEELDTLEEGGSILDADLDKLDKMTARELKALIKKRDSDLEVKDKLLAEKNKQIDEIAAENEKLRGGVAEGEPDPRVRAIESEKTQIIIPLMRLRKRALDLEAEALQGNEPPREVYFALHEAAEAFRIELAQIMDAMYNFGGAAQAALELAAHADDIADEEGIS